MLEHKLADNESTYLPLWWKRVHTVQHYWGLHKSTDAKLWVTLLQSSREMKWCPSFPISNFIFILTALLIFFYLIYEHQTSEEIIKEEIWRGWWLLTWFPQVNIWAVEAIHPSQCSFIYSVSTHVFWCEAKGKENSNKGKERKGYSLQGCRKKDRREEMKERGRR